jgi:hypothetical protein
LAFRKLCTKSRFCTKNRLDTHLVKRLYENADVVAQHSAEAFVDLPRVTLASQRVAELALNHRVGAFYVRPLEVVLRRLWDFDRQVRAGPDGWSALGDAPRLGGVGAVGGSINSATRTLLRIGLAKRRTKPGERRDYFRVKSGAWHELMHRVPKALSTFRHMAEADSTS